MGLFHSREAEFQRSKLHAKQQQNRLKKLFEDKTKSSGDAPKPWSEVVNERGGSGDDNDIYGVQDLPYDLLMHIFSFTDRKTLLFSVATSSRSLFFMSKMCNRKFHVSPLSLSILSLERYREDGSASAPVLSLDNGGSSVTLKMVVDALCNSEWSHWFYEVSFAVSRNVSEVLRTMAVSKDSPHAASKYLFGDQIDISHLQQIREFCPRVVALNLNACYNINNKCCFVLGSFENLRRLNLMGTSINKYGFDNLVSALCKSQSNDTLREIHVDSSVGWQGLKQLIDKCPRLTTLTIHCPYVKIGADPFIDLEDVCPGIKRLVLNGSVDGRICSAIGKIFPSLTSLTIHRDELSPCYLSLENMLKTLDSDLQELNLSSSFTTFSNADLIFKHLPLLTSLQLHELPSITHNQTAQSNWAVSASNLQCLRLSASAAPANFYSVLAQNSLSLKVLDIDRKRLDIIGSICFHAVNLEDLTIRCCEIPDIGYIPTFIDSLRSLKFLKRLELLEMKRAQNISELVTALVTTEGPPRSQLQQFSLREFSDWTTESIDQFFNSLPEWDELQRLNMKSCFPLVACSDDMRSYVKTLFTIVEQKAPFVVLHSL